MFVCISPALFSPGCSRILLRKLTNYVTIYNIARRRIVVGTTAIINGNKMMEAASAYIVNL
jgi:hypothetical protein